MSNFDEQLREYVEATQDAKPAGRRERIATAAPISFELAMRLYGDGNLLRLYGDGDRAAFFAHWASLSREWADALIAELDKEK